MIRCPTIDREVPVTRCLEYQQPRIGKDSWNKGELTVYPCCTGCRTGELLRLGKVDEAKQSTEKEEMVKEKTADETGLKETQSPREKQCKGCKKFKPLGEFPKDKKAKDGHRGMCLECNRTYRQDWKDKTIAKLVEAEAKSSNKRAPAQPATTEGVTAPVPRQETPAAAHIITLDFSVYPEVLDEIKHLAAWEERPPEVQARLMLRRLLRPGTDERRRAQSNGERYQPMFLAATPDASPLTPDRSEAACA